MSHGDFQPGQIWPGTALTRPVLKEQWSVELNHRGSIVDLAQIIFTESAWEDLEWNAREALHLNHRWPNAPGFWRHLFVPQDSINTHLLRSLQMLLCAWQQWTQIPYVRASSTLPAAAECRSILLQAEGRLDEAKEKQDSLLLKKEAWRQFSLRQWRVYQQISALFNDLEPLVRGSAEWLDKRQGQPASQIPIEDIHWHSRELLLHVKRPQDKPGLLERFKAPRCLLNQWIGANILHHSSLIQSLVNVN